MKTLIAYSTHHGCTATIARELASEMGGDVTLLNLKNNPNPILSEFQRIVIGGSIRAGQIQKRVKSFCNSNLEELLQKELGLFIACMEEGETAGLQLQNAYPEALLNAAKSTGYLGGEFNFRKMNFLERLMVKKVAKIDHSISKVDHDAIRRFSERMDRIFNPFLFLA